MVPLFDGGDDVGMVLSPQVRGFECLFILEKEREETFFRSFFILSQPSLLPFFLPSLSTPSPTSTQCFHNLNPHADIFNHSNVHFWE